MKNIFPFEEDWEEQEDIEQHVIYATIVEITDNSITMDCEISNRTIQRRKFSRGVALDGILPANVGDRIKITLTTKNNSMTIRYDKI